MSRPQRVSRSRFPFPVLCTHPTEPLEPRLLLAAGPAMVKDINAVSASSDPFSFIAFKGETFFRANDGAHGIEWFRTDGTPGGTSMLVDLNPGTGSSFPGGFIGDARENPTAAVLGDALIFSGFAPGGAGSELYKTDGTAAGTVLLKDIRPNGNSVPQQFMLVGNTLYFTADDGTSGRQIWKTDGTEAGTVRVSDIPNTIAALAPVPLGALGNRLVFAARSDDGATVGRELWITDGTPAGTTLLKNIHPSGTSNPGYTGNAVPEAVVVGNHLYFAATDPTFGRELWRTDGTPQGTVMVAELVPGPGSSTPTNLTAVNDNLYFTATLPPGVGGTSGVYWRDPTGAINEISPLTQFGSGVGFPGSAGNVGGVFYLGAWFNNAAVLFKHDPATATPGTNLTVVKGLAQATNWHLSAGPILDLGGRAYLLAQGPAGSNTIHLWRSDGTSQGTVELATFQVPRIADNSEFVRWNLARGANNLLYFAGNTLLGGTEPVRTDGTAAGTFGLGEINGNTQSSNPSAVVYLGGNRWVFNAENPLNGRELWVTNGTESGTSLVKDIAPGPLSSFRAVPFHMTPALNGRTYFAATSVGATDSIDTELWTSDGTPQGTYRLETYPPNFGPRGFAALNGKMYFTAGTSERGLWETDGTEAGTRLVFPLDRITFGPLIHVGGLLYFTTHRADTGSELWKTDGTAAGTRRVSAFSQEPTGTASAPVAMGGVRYYIGPIDAERHGLWRADGTPGAAALVKELPAGFPAAPFTHLLVAGDRLLLSRGAPYERVESDVWVSDGTADGTVPLASLVPALEGFAGDARFLGDVQLLGAGGAAYFFGDADPGDPGIWRTDGTAEGTRLLRFFPPQTPLSALGVVDGQVYFSAGDQLWRTDGTEAGTVRVNDAPAVGDADRGDFTFFAGSDPAHGTELWARPREEAEVYVRGSAWAESFNTYLGHNGLGDFGYGYRVDDKGAGDVLPWIKLDQIVVRYAPGEGTPGGPTPGLVTIRSQRGAAYAVTRVGAVPGDPLAFVFALDRPLGGDGPDETRNGDRLTLNIAGAGPNGTSLALRLNVLQGDVNADGSVLARDFADVKKKFFSSTGGPTDPADPSTDYSPFHDVDGSGAILALDYAEVKKRFFHEFPDGPVATASASAGGTVVGRRTRPVTRDWFASGALIA